MAENIVRQLHFGLSISRTNPQAPTGVRPLSKTQIFQFEPVKQSGNKL